VDATVEGSHLFVVKSSFALANFDEQFYRLKEKLAERGEVIAVSPAARSDLPGTINFRILYASQLSIAEIQKETADIEDLAIVEIANNNSSTEADTTTNSRLHHQQHAESSISNSIRVDLKELDALISLTHELFRNTTIAVDLAISQLGKPHRVALAANANQIQEAFLKLETGLINLRMVSIDRVLKRAMRAGRAAARMAQKEIDFDIRGVDLRLDKHLSDAIANPLVHLVRNAVDHGIETEETRLGAGKSARGRVRIEALGNGNRIRVRVTDDGGGIDPEVVSRTAARLDLIDPDTTLDMERSLRLIFRPGFSTAPSTTNVSGRGVGLDVVETGVEQVGGEVAVWSECGWGSCFEIRLPVTFGLLRSLVVVSSENRYCIDAAQVVNSATIEACEIKELEGAEALQLENQLVPVVWMRQLLGQSKPASDNAHLSVITYQFSSDTPQSPGKRFAIVVDGIEGPEEVLVRNLGRHAGRWQGVVGATELRNGSVAIVLDVPSLL
jgi:two-component system chemotaxis sensor kinase CheA